MNDLERIVNSLRFDAQGLVAAIAQQYDTGEVLMMAWMNREAVKETLETGRAVYWSRSRQSLWRKGERSGQYQAVKEFLIDCDADTVLLKVDQLGAPGAACHTGRRSCFFVTVAKREGGWTTAVNQEPLVDARTLYED